MHRVRDDAVPAGNTPNAGHHVAYVMSRFPKLTETFVLYEMLAMEDLEFEVSIYPLLRERERVAHPEVGRLVQRARYLPFLSRKVVAAQVHFLRRRPRVYIGTIAAIVRANFGSPNYLAGGLAVFPKAAEFARIALATGVTHVHCHFSSHAAVTGFILGRLTDLPYSFTAHGSDLHVDRHMLTEKVHEAAFVVAISQYNRDLIIRHCGAQYADKTHVIHSGVDTDVFRPPHHGAAKRSAFTIACIGRFVEVKGQAYLIEACRLLAEQGSPIVCHLVGEGPRRAELEDAARAAGLEEVVTFVDPLTRNEIAELLRRVDVLVAPSVPTRDGRREGIPVVLMEAMASGVPVVASRMSGIPELVDDGVNGVLVPPRDPLALALAIERLRTDDQLRADLSMAARGKIVAEFDIRRTAEGLAGLIAPRPS